MASMVRALPRGTPRSWCTTTSKPRSPSSCAPVIPATPPPMTTALTPMPDPTRRGAPRATVALRPAECQTRLARRRRGCYRGPQRGLGLSGAECQRTCPFRSTGPPHGGQGSMKLKPLGDRLIVRAIEEEETTASGIVLPDTAKEKPQKGEVIAVGDGRFDEDGDKRIPLDVATGDTVLYSKYGGTEINFDGEELLVLRESDVLAKVQS